MAADDPLSSLARGFRQRTLSTARIASKAGLGMVRRGLGGASKLDLQNAEKLARELGRMKGLMMKFGQMASYLEGSMPPEAQKVLARLQADSQPMSYEAVERVVRDDLGAAPDVLFDDFQRTPFAAASIGQVHLAQFEGRPVAVKVQYPEVAEAIGEDLRAFGTLARFGLALMPGDGAGVVAELRERVEEECDYVAEARNVELFGRLLGVRDGASAPSLVPERSRRRVLTTAFVSGRGFADFKTVASQEAKDRAAGILFEACFGTLFQSCVFNADPHPGNYLFADDGSVTFLDFGCVKRFGADFVDTWKRIARSVVDGDRAEFRRALLDAGFVARPRRFDWDHQWEVMDYLYKPFLTPGFRYDEAYVRKSYALLMWDNPNKLRLQMPPDWLFTNRLQWGLNSVLSQLGGVADWPGMWREAIYSPTEPA